MTLEDFFTLTEIKDGLSAPSRVHELVAVMKKEKDSVVKKNISDAIRQWAAVASTIAATENNDCLDLFIQLDGLLFIDRWLKEAQRFDNEAADGLIEESLSALLRALEKLQIDKERSLSSGIWITVNSLLNHNSSRVQDRARSISSGWKQGKINDANSCNVQGSAALDANITSGSSKEETCAVDTILSKGSTGIETRAAESEAGETVQSESLHLTKNEEVKIESCSKELISQKVSDHCNTKDRAPNASDEKDNVQISKSVSDPSSMISSSVNRSCVASPPTKVELGSVSSSVGAMTIQEPEMGTCLQKHTDDKEGNFSMGAAVAVSGIGAGSTECNSDTLENFSSTRKNFEKSGESHMVPIVATDEYREHSSDGADDVSEGGSDFAEPASLTPFSYQIDSRSDIDSDYGIFDAFKVARQIAQEAEREVVDGREPSCNDRDPSCSSSSKECMGSDMKQPGTPDSINGKHNSPTDVPSSDTPKQVQSVELNSGQERHLISSDIQNEESKFNIQEQDSSQLTEMAQEPEVGKEPCGFDLNQEFCSDEMDRLVNSVSTPSVVSVSRPVAASVSPGGPLQFEGALGWRSSATTSAFRPASPRKTADCDKNSEMGGSSTSSKQRQDFLDIDLNVAEDGHEKVRNPLAKRRLSISSGIHSGESSLEVGTKRSGTPNLDLNRIIDDGDAPLPDSRIKEHLFYPRNDQRSPSPVSSSSSMKPSLRNFDLNDRPLFLNDSSSDQGLHHGKSSQNANAFEARIGDPVISIMGAKVEVGNRKDFIPHARSSNGKSFDQTMNANMARMGGFLGMAPPVSYAHSPVFGYNGLAAGPTLSMPPAMYGAGGPISYMVDSRGTPVMPQIMGSATAIPPYTHQPPFIMSMSGAPPGLNGAGPSVPSFDLNSGFALDGGSAGGLRQLQLFMPGQGRSVEDSRSNPQQFSGAVVGGKRKMPDGGWEPYSLHYTHTQPP